MIEPMPDAQRPTLQQRVKHELRTLGESLQLLPVAVGDSRRAELEAYVQARFEAKHGAQVRSFMPTLVAFRKPQGELCGVAGLRGAGASRLYLEQYLPRPIEACLREALSESSSAWPADRGRVPTISRDEIVEVGNLAGASCRAAVRMVAQLPVFLMQRRYRWITFTATSALRQILEGFGAPLVELARADAAQVAQAGDAWGRYYETDPRVYAGYLPDADRLAGFAHRAAGH